METNYGNTSVATEVTDSILRCAVAVHREIGPALPEYSYQKSLALEFDAAGISYVDDTSIAVRYRNVLLNFNVSTMTHGIKRYQL